MVQAIKTNTPAGHWPPTVYDATGLQAPRQHTVQRHDLRQAAVAPLLPVSAPGVVQAF